MALPDPSQLPDNSGGNSSFLGSLFGSDKPKFEYQTTETPFQQGLLRLLGQNIQKATATNANGTPTSSGLSPTATNSWIQRSVATPLLRQYDQSIVPRINDAYAAIGAGLSSRAGVAKQNALSSIQDTIGKALGAAQMSNQQLSVDNALKYNQLAAALSGQSQMAIQGYQQQGLFGNQGLGSVGNMLGVNNSAGLSGAGGALNAGSSSTASISGSGGSGGSGLASLGGLVSAILAII